MNRRQLLTSLIPALAALPVVAAAPKPTIKPPVTAHPICGTCHGDMAWGPYPELRGENDFDWKARQMVYCLAPYCPQFNIQFRAYPEEHP